MVHLARLVVLVQLWVGPAVGALAASDDTAADTGAEVVGEAVLEAGDLEDDVA